MYPQSLPRLSQVRKKESWVNAVFACWKYGYLKLFLFHHARICSITNVFYPWSNFIIQVFHVLCAARSLIWNKMLKTIQMKSLQVRKECLWLLSWKNQNKIWVYNLCAKYLCSVTHESLITRWRCQRIANGHANRAYTDKMCIKPVNLLYTI